MTVDVHQEHTAEQHVQAELGLRRRWAHASADIAATLLRTGADPVPGLALRALELAGAELVTVGLLTGTGHEVVVEVAHGPGAEELVATRLPVEATVAAQLHGGDAVALERAAEAGDAAQFGPVLEAGPVLALPLLRAGRLRGVVTLARRRGEPAFTPVEVEVATDFAAHAGVAVELADSRAAEQRVVLLEDRDRIARDLHDHVIQELFAIGLRLESVAAGLGADSVAGGRISARVEDLDRTIRRIRTSIFALRGPLDLEADGLRQHVLEIASDLTPALGFPPHVSFDGPIDIFTTAELADDVVAVAREALTNVAKHAGATQASIDVSAVAGELVVTVLDNGVGLGDATRSSGMGNMRARAQRHGGTMSVEPAPGGGTLLTWKAPQHHPG